MKGYQIKIIDKIPQFLYVGLINYYQFKTILNNAYLSIGTDLNFITYDDLDKLQELSKDTGVSLNAKYILDIDVDEDSFQGKERELVLKINENTYKKFALDTKDEIRELILNIINIESHLKFIDIDDKRVGIYPDNLKYKFNDFKEYLKARNIKRLIGHNIINYDKEILKNSSIYKYIIDNKFIDTLYLSLFLLKNHYNSLKKDYKVGTDKNDPIKDAKESYEWFQNELKEFKKLDSDLKQTYAFLLREDEHFSTFFEYVGLKKIDLYKNVAKRVLGRYFKNFDFMEIIKKYNIEFAIMLFSKINNFPPSAFALKNYPNIRDIYSKLHNYNDLDVVEYAKKVLEIKDFKYKSFDALESDNIFAERISQENIIKSAIQNESLLAILPTGGGKSFCYQIPAIFDSEYYSGLTLIISPLRSLMKDQIENFNKQFTQTKAGALSGFLSPSERVTLIDEIEDGKIDILYVAPESLRYQTIKKILNDRYISRIVIDEAHCLSTWGQDFRPDYRHIASFIKKDLDQKDIPISCFTATASKEVIDDINRYFEDKLSIKLKQFIASNKRTNLEYFVRKIVPKSRKNVDIDKAKYIELLKILNKEIVPAIIYIPNSILKCDEVASELLKDTSFRVKPFHSKVENREEVLKQFIDDEIDIIVATTAFGMGVDKPNIKSVIHYTPSSNIEDYLQESGRAGRDEKIVPTAKCFALYYEGDFDFYLKRLKNTLVTREEINSIYQAIKRISYGDNIVKSSALEIALEAKWDIDDTDNNDYRTKLNVILTELEEEGLIERNINETKPFATAIEVANMEEVRKKLNIENNHDIKDDIKIQFEIMRLIQNKSRKQIGIDDLCYILDIEKQKVVLAIEELKEKRLISDDKEIKVRLKPFQKRFFDLEKVLLGYISDYGKLKLREIVNSNELNLWKSNKKTIQILEKILRDWKNDKNVEIRRIDKKYSIWSFKIKNPDKFKNDILDKIVNAKKIYEYIKNKKSNEENISINLQKMKKELQLKLTNKKLDKLLVYLHYTGSIDLLDGTFIYYTAYNIKILERIPRYIDDMYKKRKKPYYDNQRQKIHIMNEFLQKQINNKDIDKFLKNYFILSLKDFIERFLSSAKRKYINAFVTKSRFDNLYEKLTKEQKNIVDSKANSIMVLAGPGSGKTKTLVHKISNMILNDQDVKPEHFLMLTHTKSATLEFRNRLYELIGQDAYKLDIYTFHGFLNYITGKMGLKDKNSNFYIPESMYSEILPFKTALYLDEYQDIYEDTFNFVCNIVENSDIDKIVAVGDDDQLVMKFNGADPKYFDKFWDKLNKNRENKRVEFSLLTNFRSDKKIVEFANSFIKQLSNRKKQRPLVSASNKEGEVKLFKYNTECLYEPLKNQLVNLLESNQDMSIGILTHTNDESLTLQAFLEDNGIKSKLILEKERFVWKNLIEIYDLNEMILELCKNDKFSEKVFKQATDKIIEKYKNSTNLDKIKLLANRFIDKEEYALEKWNIFIDDLDDDFFEKNADKNNKITITTIHKAKGREYDSVFLLDQKNKYNKTINDELIRKYYVAITRARHKLFIFTNFDYFDDCFGENIIFDRTAYSCPKKLIIYMGLGDIKLDGSNENNLEKYNKNIQHINLMAGDKIVNDRWYLKKDGLVIAEMSGIYTRYKQEKFQKKLKNIELKGYTISNITVDCIVKYFVSNRKDFLDQVLCKIELEKS